MSNTLHSKLFRSIQGPEIFCVSGGQYAGWSGRYPNNFGVRLFYCQYKQ